LEFDFGLVRETPAPKKKVTQRVALVDDAVGFWDYWISGLTMEDRERVVVEVKGRGRVGGGRRWEVQLDGVGGVGEGGGGEGELDWGWWEGRRWGGRVRWGWWKG